MSFSKENTLQSIITKVGIFLLHFIISLIIFMFFSYLIGKLIDLIFNFIYSGYSIVLLILIFLISAYLAFLIMDKMYIKHKNQENVLFKNSTIYLILLVYLVILVIMSIYIGVSSYNENIKNFESSLKDLKQSVLSDNLIYNLQLSLDENYNYEELSFYMSSSDFLNSYITDIFYDEIDQSYIEVFSCNYNMNCKNLERTENNFSEIDFASKNIIFAQYNNSTSLDIYVFEQKNNTFYKNLYDDRDLELSSKLNFLYDNTVYEILNSKYKLRNKIFNTEIDTLQNKFDVIYNYFNGKNNKYFTDNSVILEKTELADVHLNEVFEFIRNYQKNLTNSKSFSQSEENSFIEEIENLDNNFQTNNTITYENYSNSVHLEGIEYFFHNYIFKSYFKNSHKFYYFKKSFEELNEDN